MIVIDNNAARWMRELDRFIHAVKSIIKEAQETPELVKTAPHEAPYKRFDETLAARKPILRWEASS